MGVRNASDGAGPVSIIITPDGFMADICFRTNGNIGINVLDRGVFVCPNLRGGSDLFGTKCAGLAGADSIGSNYRVSERTPTIAGLNVFVWRQEGEMFQPQLPDRLPQRDWTFFSDTCTEFVFEPPNLSPVFEPPNPCGGSAVQTSLELS